MLLPRTSSWVIAMRPITLVANIASISSSLMSPTCSRPFTKPALLTDRYYELGYLSWRPFLAYIPRMSTSRSSWGTLVQRAAICALSDTSSWIDANFPPCCNPDSLWAAAQASATFARASALLARRITLAPPWQSSRKLGEQGKAGHSHFGEQNGSGL